MKNWQVAKMIAFNALAYLKSGDLETVKTNLEYIEKLLEHPDAENTEYEWEDFK